VAHLGTLRSLDDLRALAGLVPLFDDPDQEKRLLACAAFLQRFERNPHSYFLSNPLVAAGLERIGGLIEGPGKPEEDGREAGSEPLTLRGGKGGSETP
jgi:hypothetical protein